MLTYFLKDKNLRKRRCVMLKSSKYLFLFLCSLIFTSFNGDSAEQAYEVNVPTNIQAEKALISDLYHIATILLERVGPCPDEKAPLQEWNSLLQKKFLRPANQDHQHVHNLPQYAEHSQLMPYFGKAWAY
jgi:hypothetical protein